MNVGAFYAVASQGLNSTTPQLVQAPTTAAAASAKAACASPGLAGYRESGGFAWGRHDDVEDICASGSLKWVIPGTARVSCQVGTVASQPVLLVTEPLALSHGSTDNTAVDVLMPGAVVLSATAQDGAADITKSGITITGTQGSIREANTYGPTQRGQGHRPPQPPNPPSGHGASCGDSLAGHRFSRTVR